MRERWIKEFQVYVFLSELQPGQRDVGGNGKSEEGADGQEHRVGVDKGEQEDADGREDKGAVHNKEGVDKGKVRQPPEQVALAMRLSPKTVCFFQSQLRKWSRPNVRT